MPKFVAKYASCGFRNRYWEEGQTVIVTAKEAKECDELKTHFTLYKTPEQLEEEEATLLESEENDKENEDDLLQLTNEQLKERLIEAGIDIPRNATKAQLIKLLQE